MSNYPAKLTVHWLPGPIHACEFHATKLIALMGFLGTHVTATEAPEGAQCENCANEAMLAERSKS